MNKIKISDKAQKILNDSIIWDNSLLWAEMLPNKKESLEHLYNNNVNVVSMKINSAQTDFISNIRAVILAKNELSNETNKYKIVNSIKDINHVKQENKIGITFSLCDSSIIEDIESDFDVFSALGVTHTVLCAERNKVGDSCWEPTDVGLSNYGRYFVKKSNSKKIILDGTLSGYKTTMEAMELCEKPFIFSHTNPYSVCINKRNIKDDQIKACANTDGVIGITLLGGYLGEKDPSYEIMFKNIDHICDLVGPEHVGFGSNYSIDPSEFWNSLRFLKEEGEIGEGTCYSYKKLIELIQIMLDHGYREEQIKLILGENWLRIFNYTK